MRYPIKHPASGIREEKGFALLFAVLTGSVLLSIGLSIFNLTVKELLLSSSGRESQFAFYAADTGAECALYWDFKGTGVFATSSSTHSPSPSNPDCVDTIGTPQTINVTNYLSRTSNSAVTQFSLTIPNSPAAYCAIVTVTKTAPSGIIKTEIDSRGYNTCDTTDKGRVERALKVSY
ncbi:MAG: hypothetical protein HZA81_02725 [Candidatus Taylorbacteria bacterium]|nr:hypothetical protein [Candidatus Taylorbacteria bacterium]